MCTQYPRYKHFNISNKAMPVVCLFLLAPLHKFITSGTSELGLNIPFHRTVHCFHACGQFKSISLFSLVFVFKHFTETLFTQDDFH